MSKIKHSACFEDKTELCQLTLQCAVCKVQWFGVYLVYTPHCQAIIVKKEEKQQYKQGITVLKIFIGVGSISLDIPSEILFYIDALAEPKNVTSECISDDMPPK